jgi:hypothetical protein
VGTRALVARSGRQVFGRHQAAARHTA